MATDLTKAKRKRTAKKNVVAKTLLPECEQIILKYRSQEAKEEAVVMIQTLEQMEKEVKALDDEVSNLTEEEGELEKNESEAYEFLIRIRKMKAKLHNFAEEKDMKLLEEGEIKKNGVKFPKIKIKCFDGDAVEWKPFLEAFNVTIHERTDISEIEKFSYLRGLLSGPALKAIEGMPLTSENYYHSSVETGAQLSPR